MFRYRLVTLLTLLIFCLFLESCLSWFKKKPKTPDEPVASPSPSYHAPVRSTIDASTSCENLSNSPSTHENPPTPPSLDIQHLYTQASNDIRGKDLTINAIDAYDFTALYEAVSNNDILEAKRLLRLGANPNIWGKRKIPLQVAFRNNNIALIQLLLDNGAVIVDKQFTFIDILGNLDLNSDPIIQAIILNHFSGQPSKTNGDDSIFGKDLSINAVDDFGYTTLYHAITNNDVSEVARLLRLGANPNIWGKQKIPLNAAVRDGEKEIVQLLLDNGAVIVDESISQRDILRSSQQYPEIHTLLLDHLSSKTASHKAYKDLHDPEIDRNSNKNYHDSEVEVDINAMDNCGETALHKAIIRKDIAEAKRLLALGADPNIYGKGSLYSPLYIAVIDQDKEMVQLLLDHGAAVVFKSEYQSPMLNTARIKNKEIFYMLLCQLASSGRKDDVLGSTPLHWACRDGYLKVVEHIFATDPTVDVNDIDPTYNFTPLHWAAMRGHKEIVDFLLSKGANKRAKSKNGFTPLMLAISNQHNGLRGCLSPDGFDRTIKNLYADWTCTVCLEGLEGSRYKVFPMVPLPCGHKFHTPCIVGHVVSQTKNFLEINCPNCRTPLSDEMVYEIKGLMGIPSHSSFSVNYAVSKYDKARLKTLLANGGNVHDICCISKHSSLITSILRETYDLVPLLLAFGSDVNYLVPSTFDTPLHCAAMRLFSKPAKRADAQAIIVALIQHGAIVNATNVECKTPASFCLTEDMPIFFEAGGIRSGYFNDIKYAFDLGGYEEVRKILHETYKPQK